MAKVMTRKDGCLSGPGHEAGGVLQGEQVLSRPRLGFQGLDSEDLSAGELDMLRASGTRVRSKDLGRVNFLYLLAEISGLRRTVMLFAVANEDNLRISANWKRRLARGTMTTRQVCEEMGLVKRNEKKTRKR